MTITVNHMGGSLMLCKCILTTDDGRVGFLGVMILLITGVRESVRGGGDSFRIVIQPYNCNNIFQGINSGCKKIVRSGQIIELILNYLSLFFNIYNSTLCGIVWYLYAACPSLLFTHSNLKLQQSTIN